MIRLSLVTSQIFFLVACSNIIVSIQGENGSFLRGHREAKIDTTEVGKVSRRNEGSNESVFFNRNSTDDYYSNETDDATDDFFEEGYNATAQTLGSDMSDLLQSSTEEETQTEVKEAIDEVLEPVKEGEETLDELMNNMDDEEFFEDLPEIAEELVNGTLVIDDDELAAEVVELEEIIELDDYYLDDDYFFDANSTENGSNVAVEENSEESWEEILESTEDVDNEKSWEKSMEERTEAEGKEDIDEVLKPVKEGEETLDELMNNMDDEEFFEDLPEIAEELVNGTLVVDDDELVEEVLELEEVVEVIDEINEFEKEEQIEYLEEAITYGDDFEVFEAVDIIAEEMEEGLIEIDDDQVVEAIDTLEEIELEEEFENIEIDDVIDDDLFDEFDENGSGEIEEDDFDEEMEKIYETEYEPPTEDPLVEEFSESSSLFEEPDVGKLSFGLLVFSFIFMIFTAYQVAENPDGIFASICRLFITAGVFVLKMVMYPFRRYFGGNYSHQRIHTPSYSASSNFEIS